MKIRDFFNSIRIKFKAPTDSIPTTPGEPIPVPREGITDDDIEDSIIEYWVRDGRTMDFSTYLKNWNESARSHGFKNAYDEARSNHAEYIKARKKDNEQMER